jgi:hypothetical protein
MLDLTYKRNRIFGGKWDFSFRNRWEILNSDEVDNTRRVRGRIKIRRDLPRLSIRERPLQLQVYGELFYDFEEGEISENRAGIGVVFPVLRKSELTVNAEWKRVQSYEFTRESDDTALLSVSLSYDLPKDWLAAVIGGEVGERMKTDKTEVDSTLDSSDPLREMSLETPSIESPIEEPTINPNKGTVSGLVLNEIPWEEN